ncbi:hypothetical protein CAG70_12060 [Photobacterium halotolerans]|uniref:hypothetical protein n=1 Tax=Photobacterium halotolerans TaxID=265726 RepID=UPI001372D812|nr:hypothetical protein [Photobacterium halotolerans]NAX47722.1 hypothetical protein [Photobacterium halotolerans]
MENGLQKALQQQWSSPVFDPNLYFSHVKTWMQVHRAWEAIAAKQFSRATHDGYDNTLKQIEQADKVLNEKVQQTKEQGLVFPFDMMQLASENMLSGWLAMTGQESAAADHSQQLEELEQALALMTSECEKAQKAKQTAQRNQRKVKTDLDASTAKVASLNEELRAVKAELAEANKLAKKEQAELLAGQKTLQNENDALKKQLKELQSQLVSQTKASQTKSSDMS